MNNYPFVIGISGAVGSGKTWFANRLKESISDVVCIFSLDNYSKDLKHVENLEFTYDNPLAIDYDKAYEDLSKLLQGEKTDLPIYDYISHSVVSSKSLKSPSVIIIDGLYAFSDPRFLDKMDIKIWIEVDEDTCRRRRVYRDINERGESRENSLARHYNYSEPALKKYYINKRSLADCIYFNVQEESDKYPKLMDLIVSYYDGFK